MKKAVLAGLLLGAVAVAAYAGVSIQVSPASVCVFGHCH